jgi:hypothetical protein
MNLCQNLPMLPQWTVMGDFNVIYRTTQKSNGRINFRLMNRFLAVLNSLELRELHLRAWRRFTWSNGTDTPTFSRIDHQNCYLQALSSSMSDHSPLLLSY